MPAVGNAQANADQERHGGGQRRANHSTEHQAVGHDAGRPHADGHDGQVGSHRPAHEDVDDALGDVPHPPAIRDVIPIQVRLQVQLERPLHEAHATSQEPPQEGWQGEVQARDLDDAAGGELGPCQFQAIEPQKHAAQGAAEGLPVGVGDDLHLQALDSPTQHDDHVKDDSEQGRGHVRPHPHHALRLQLRQQACVQLRPPAAASP
eukprot:scaffold772_cov236-Pinguiococcus_pyrenoidosus.AAC.1